MQDEFNEARAAGYWFAETQGGETAFGGREAVAGMVLDPEARRFRYMLLATSRNDGGRSRRKGASPDKRQ